MCDADKSDNTPAYAFTRQQRLKIVLALVGFLRANGQFGAPAGDSIDVIIEKLEAIWEMN